MKFFLWFSLRFFRKERGTTLVEILVGMTIFGIVVMGISEFFRNTEKTKKKIYLKRVMERISNDLYQKSRDPFSVYLSLRDELNQDFRDCVYGSTSGCSALDEASRSGFRLNQRVSSESTEAITGALNDSDSPVCFNTNGALCPCSDEITKGATCAFITESSFYVTCPENSNGIPCEKGADSVHITYTIKQRSGVLKSLGDPMRDLPEREFFIHHTAESIFNPSYNSECNTGAVLIGFDTTGRGLCQCTSTYEKTGENNRGPLCTLKESVQFECPEYTVPIAMDANSNIQCLTFDEAYVCETYEGEAAKEPCPQGYWVQKYHRNNCRFHCTIKDPNGGECSNLDPQDSSVMIEDQYDSITNEKTGVWCYGDDKVSPVENDKNDIKVCCYRRYSF